MPEPGVVPSSRQLTRSQILAFVLGFAVACVSALLRSGGRTPACGASLQPPLTVGYTGEATPASPDPAVALQVESVPLQSIGGATHADIPGPPGRGRAYVITMNRFAEKAVRSAEIMSRCGQLSVVFVHPPDHKSAAANDWAVLHRLDSYPDIYKGVRAVGRPGMCDACAHVYPPPSHQMSLSMTNEAVWRRIAYDGGVPEGGYGMVIEEDIELHASVKCSDLARILDVAAGLSATPGEGVFSLGLCGSEKEFVCDSDRAKTVENIKYEWCNGHCSHAYGVHKFAAEWLAEDIMSKGGNVHEADLYINAFGNRLLVGDDLTQANDPRLSPSFRGVLYQERLKYNQNQSVSVPVATAGPWAMG